jgi:hypothetical protein
MEACRLAPEAVCPMDKRKRVLACGSISIGVAVRALEDAKISLPQEAKDQRVLCMLFYVW